jgi:hypothetical protein
MPLAVVVSSKFGSGRIVRVLGTLTPSGSYATNGDALPGSAFGAGTTKKPHSIDVNGKGLYTYNYDVEAGKLKVYTAGAEIAAGAYPAGVTSDVIRFDATFPKFG